MEPLIFSGLIVLHVPYIFGTLATLLLLDDLDVDGLRALSVSPLGIRDTSAIGWPPRPQRARPDADRVRDHCLIAIVELRLGERHLLQRSYPT